MMRFEPFVRLEVEHGYFAATPAPVTLEPDAATARLFRLPDLTARLSPGRAVIYAAEARDGLKAFAGEGGLTFVFRVRAADAWLPANTDAVDLAADKMPVATVPAGDPTDIGAAQMRPRAVDEDITAEDVRRPPLAILRVLVAPEARDEVRRARFAASSRRWTYHVMGGDAIQDMAVRDRDGRIAFDSLGRLELSNGRAAQSFRTRTPIVASERQTERFELVGAGAHGERVLIPMLPYPGPGSLRLARDDAAAAPVSEIYVTLP